MFQEQLLFTDGTNYSNPEVINAFLNNFYTNLPIFGYNETLLKNVNELLFPLAFNNPLANNLTKKTVIIFLACLSGRCLE